MKKYGCLIGALVAVGLLGLYLMSTYNGLVAADEEVKQKWSAVESAYQRRADLVPNLVATVKGSANFEQETLTRVIEARSKATSVQINADNLSDPQKFAQFQQAQDGLSSALSRLLAVVESYPQLQSVQGFRDLMVQLEGTENRITTARNRFIKAVQEFNILARQFPTNLTAMMFGYKEKPSFTVEDEKAISRPPKVDFAPKPAAPAQPAPAQPAPAQPAPAK